jgi:hypothetical protein
MDAKDFDEACTQLAREIEKERLYGNYDNDKEIWDQPCEGIQVAWGLITRGSNQTILRKRLGTARNPDWNRIYAEAHRQSILRSQLRDLSDGQ